MATVINGTFSLRDVIQKTYYSDKKTRFDYQERDVLKAVHIIRETTLQPDRNKSPTHTLIYKSFSYPQYKPYTRWKTGKKQRKFKHQYDQILSIVADDDGKFSLDSRNWKYRLGSQAKWEDNVPQKYVKTIYRATSAKWKSGKEKEKEGVKKRFSGEKLKKELEAIDVKYRKIKENHVKSAEFADKGDWNSRVKGLNGDFYFRCQSSYRAFGHLYGRETYKSNVSDKNVFAPKHLLALIDFLVKKNFLV